MNPMIAQTLATRLFDDRSTLGRPRPATARSRGRLVRSLRRRATA